MIDSVVFDFDGTIADTMPQLERLGVELITEEWGSDWGDPTDSYRATIGRSFPRQLEMMQPGREAGGIVEQFNSRREHIYNEAELKPGASALLRSLHENRVRVFIVSSTDKHVVERFLERHAARAFVHLPSMPKKLAIEKVIADGCRPLFIGDAPYDELLASWLGVPFIGVPGTFGPAAFASPISFTLKGLGPLILHACSE